MFLPANGVQTTFLFAISTYKWEHLTFLSKHILGTYNLTVDKLSFQDTK